MAAPIVGEATLHYMVDVYLGDDGEVGPVRWWWRLLRKLGASDEWIDEVWDVRGWWRDRFDEDVTNDSH